MYSIDIDASSPYSVMIDTFLLERVGEISRGVCSGARALIITDSNVGPLYARPVADGLEEAGFSTSVATFEAGERSKTPATYIDMLGRAAAHGMDRSDLIVALGGGVVGDVAGFVAATYMRGIGYVQVPTTLLAMVDSSVGGKTAIDLPAGKNLAGAFWQPRAVIADIGCLATLSEAQFADGCGEVVKHAAIADADLFAELEATPLTLDLLKSDLDRAAWLIARNVDIKRAVVAADEREAGMRKMLNFGHTIGHGIEAAERYRLGHGACVGIGMLAMACASVAASICSDDVADRIAALLTASGLDIEFDASPADVLDAALHDKKRTGDLIDLVVPRSIGAVSIAPTPIDEFARILEVGLACAAAYSEPHEFDEEE